MHRFFRRIEKWVGVVVINRWRSGSPRLLFFSVGGYSFASSSGPHLVHIGNLLSPLMEHTFLSRRSIKFLENKIKSIWGRLMIAYETSPAIMGHPFQKSHHHHQSSSISSCWIIIGMDGWTLMIIETHPLCLLVVASCPPVHIFILDFSTWK